MMQLDARLSRRCCIWRLPPARSAARAPQHLRLALVAPSLGGVETLVTRPATTTHVGLPREQRLAIGIRDELVRVALGIEDAQDLVDDFMAALDAAAAAAAAAPAAAAAAN